MLFSWRQWRRADGAAAGTAAHLIEGSNPGSLEQMQPRRYSPI
jgi:hypothetical protein